MTPILPKSKYHARSLRTAAAVLSVCAAVSVLSVAAPTLPRLVKVADEILSTTEIQQVRLAVSPLPRALEDAGLSIKAVRKISEAMLVEAGYTVGTDRLGPKLVVTILNATSTDVADGMALTATIDVHQDVSVHRIDMDLNVPTMTIVVPDLVSVHKLQQGGKRLCREALNLLLKTFELANDAVPLHEASES